LDPRFKKINRILTNYASGNFKQTIKPSTKLDEVDAFIECVNMLGEELKETTISKNHFNNIFNSVSDMIFVLDEKGKIQNTSQSVHTILQLDWYYFKNRQIDTLVAKKHFSLFNHIQTNLKNKKGVIEIEIDFKTINRKSIPTHNTAVYLFNEKGKKIGYLLVVKDLTHIKHYEFSLKESEEKYKKIFEETTDCIFTSNSKGDIIDINNAGRKMLNIGKADIVNKNIANLFYNRKNKIEFFKTLKEKKAVANFPAQITSQADVVLDSLISANSIQSSTKKIVGYQGIIKDISKQKQTEKLILKTIVSTQEEERKRFAKDIHDSLGQQLSAIKFYIGTTVATTNDENQKKILTKANDALLNTLLEMRNICFNLMPKTLENYGLVASIRELCKQIEINKKLNFKLYFKPNFPLLNKQLEIAIFRIVQEFINNSLKHSKANIITIQLNYSVNFCQVILKDNGVGFDINDAKKKSGMGLSNVHSRIIPYNGEVNITSSFGKGVKYVITLPLLKTNLKNNESQ
jgi:PAS domain S-box-containing protein